MKASQPNDDGAVRGGRRRETRTDAAQSRIEPKEAATSDEGERTTGRKTGRKRETSASQAEAGERRSFLGARVLTAAATIG
jgi:hypothetical protein